MDQSTMYLQAIQKWQWIFENPSTDAEEVVVNYLPQLKVYTNQCSFCEVFLQSSLDSICDRCVLAKWVGESCIMPGSLYQMAKPDKSETVKHLLDTIKAIAKDNGFVFTDSEIRVW